MYILRVAHLVHYTLCTARRTHYRAQGWALEHDPPHDEPFESFRKRMTAAQCREHRWLARKVHKTRSEKEVAGFAEAKRTAFIENRPIVDIDNSREELDVTKDNLRQFVERWREHPDSPYTITDSYHARQPASDREESVSLRAHSPSPCDSLRSSSTLSEKTMDSARDNSSHLLSVPASLSLSLERRASEGTALRHRRDPASQIALAEEIIKLSEHLRAIAMGSNEGNNVDVTEATQHSMKRPGEYNRGTYSKSSVTVTVSRNDGETNEITEKLSNITRQRKLNGTTFYSSRSFDKYNADTNSGNNMFVALRRTSIGDAETSDRRKGRKSYEQRTITEAVEEKLNEEAIEKRTTLQTSFVDAEDREMDLTPPWRRLRVKRSFGETSRDVPRISNLRDLHKNLNLNEPGSTKDLLLHLLGEWEDATATSYGRKSISLDWRTADTVARKTMNSLAEYFQSKQQVTKSPDVVSSTSSSTYR